MTMHSITMKQAQAAEAAAQRVRDQRIREAYSARAKNWADAEHRDAYDEAARRANDDFVDAINAIWDRYRIDSGAAHQDAYAP